MAINVQRRAVGVFSERRDVEQALHELRDSGFPMERVSVIARHKDEGDEIAGKQIHEKVGDQSEEGAKVGVVSGGILGGLTGLLIGLGTLAIPGIGPIMLAGATATAIATTAAGVGIGAIAGGLIGALIGLGIPEERARAYHERVERGDYLVIIDGTDAEIARLQPILHKWGIEEFEIYDHPNGKQVTTEDISHRDMTVTQHAIGYFSMLQDAEAAINDLRNAGFSLRQISLIHRENPQRDAFAGIHVSDSIEPTRLNIPDQRTQFYNDCIHQGNYIIIVSGSDAELQRAAAIIGRHHIKQWEIYEANGHVVVSQTAKRAVGIFTRRRDVEAALRELGNAGFPMNQVSLIAKDTNGGIHRNLDNLEPGHQAGEGVKAGAATGVAIGGLGGLLVGLGTLAIPAVGPVMVAGAAATALATTLAGGAVGAAVGGIAGGLVGLGIPRERAQVYSDRFQRGDHLVIVDGTETEIHHAETILKPLGVEEFATYDAHDLREHQTSFEPVKHPESVPRNYAGENPVIILDHRQKTV